MLCADSIIFYLLGVSLQGAVQTIARVSKTWNNIGMLI